ncbi:MAG: hypothetical protein OEW48_18845 [Phycisphaerae bacterium]|nr:hypothetical protein [Phycisphaerae bacterium]
MNVTSILTKDYENISPIRAPKKQSQILKRQKPMQPSLPKGIMKKTAFSGYDKTKPKQIQSPDFSNFELWFYTFHFNFSFFFDFPCFLLKVAPPNHPKNNHPSTQITN